MIKDLGCKYVIIGHSERRQYFGETDETVNKRIYAALKTGLIPIVCVGETLSEREANNTFKVVERQIKEGLKNLSKEQMRHCVIAYEPVWAIGTGKTATPAQAQEVHSFIRKLLPNLFDKEVSSSTRILYGGSVKPDNMSDLMKEQDIDGGLVGGASLEAESFAKIVKY
jgi:triosephosphate isomerase